MLIRASVAWNTSILLPKKLLHSYRGQLYVRKGVLQVMKMRIPW